MYDSSDNNRNLLAEANAGKLPSKTSSVQEAEGAAYRTFLAAERRRVLVVRMTQLLVLIVFLALWQTAASLHWVDTLLTGSPSQIVSMFGQLAHEGKLWTDTWITAKETVIGFVISMVVGVFFAIILWASSFVSKVADPYLVILNALPKVALGPIFFIWLGDQLSIYGMAIAISLVVTIIMLATGFQEIDQGKLKVMQSFGASRWQILRIVVLPASVPNIVATMKVNVGLTLVGVIMGEFLSAKAGLGFLITYGGQIFEMNLVMTSIMMLVVLSLVMYGLVTYLGRWMLRKYHFE